MSKTTKTSPSKVKETKLPKEYQPEILKAVENSSILGRITMYGIGVSDGKVGFGMSHGPFSNLNMALEIVPGADTEVFPPRFTANQAQILRFNADETSNTLYDWKDDRWILREGAS